MVRRMVGNREPQRFMVGLMSLVALALAALSGPGTARAFTCSAAVDRTTVAVGGVVVLTVKAEGDVGWSAEFDLGAPSGVRLASGGTNQSMTMVNGRTQTSVSRTYYLTVVGDADFTIPPVLIVSGRDECRTEAIPIKVDAGSGGGVPPADSGNRVPRPGGPGTPASRKGPGGAIRSGSPGDDVFITLEADRNEAHVGQQIILTFRYWWRVRPWNNPGFTEPRTEGFWREDLGTERNFREVVQGLSYNVTQKRYALFPTRTGDLVIEPAVLTFQEDVFDRFFSSRQQQRGPRVLRTDSLVIRVSDLPGPVPEGFSGIVASRLDLEGTLDKEAAVQGEPIGLKVQLVSDGFLKGFPGLKVEGPPGSRIHDAAEHFETSIQGSRLLGKVATEKVIVPSVADSLVIPPVEVVWFDTKAGAFRTAVAAFDPLPVKPGNDSIRGAESSGFLRSEIARLGEDLAFIHPAPRDLSTSGAAFTGGPLWWILLLAPLGLLGGWRLVLEKSARELRDPAGLRRRRALEKALGEVKAGAEESDPALAGAALARALCGYVADCLDLPPAAVDGKTVAAYARDHGYQAEGDALQEILAVCDAARFGGGEGAALSGLSEDLVRILRTLDAAGGRRKARRVPGAAGAALLILGGILCLFPGQGRVWAQPRPGSDPVRLLAEGNQAYTEGAVDRALDLYLQARDLGVDDPVLHYNLGNAFARSGQLGKAVASYLRAEKLAPGDGDIQANLAWVRRHIQDLELNEGELPLFIAQIAGLVRSLTADQWGTAVLVLVWILAALVGWSWYAGGVTDGLRRIMLVVLGVLALASAATGWRFYQDEVRALGVVTAAEASVRSGPAPTFPVLFEVHDGLTVNLEGEREGWVRVSLGGEWVGWLPAESVEAVDLR